MDFRAFDYRNVPFIFQRACDTIIETWPPGHLNVPTIGATILDTRERYTAAHHILLPNLSHRLRHRGDAPYGGQNPASLEVHAAHAAHAAHATAHAAAAAGRAILGQVDNHALGGRH